MRSVRRIAMISEHASPLAGLGSVDSGGQNVYVAQLAKGLAKNGYEVDVFTRRDDASLPDVVPWHPGSRIIHVPAGPAASIPKEELLPHMPEFTGHVLEHCVRRRYDLIHAHFWMSGMAAADLKEALGIPFVVTFHALGRIRRTYQGPDDRFPDCRFAVEERIVRAADCVIAECPQDHADLLDYYAADPARIAIVPCGFDPEELWPVERCEARERLGIDRDAFVVLQLGRMVPRKGIRTVVEGFACFHRDASRAELLVVGGESRDPDPKLTPEIGHLEELARAHGVGHSVRFTGRRDRDELRYYYSASDVFVTLPWYEPFGITPLEAMACAIPVIGSRVGGVKYTVQDGVTGCLIPSAAPEALAACLKRLYRDRGLAEDYGRCGRARALRWFTWTKVVRQIQAAYDEVIAGRVLPKRRLGPLAVARGSGARRAIGSAGERIASGGDIHGPGGGSADVRGAAGGTGTLGPRRGFERRS
ncbi:MAG TPA: glycosyltransferase family 1 protein [Gammaproteobacteria bacterium]|nr:glycosyltransferase family 1 protein [Gammaproteobacteria bacterium]